MVIIIGLSLLIISLSLIYLFSDEHLDKVEEKMIKKQLMKYIKEKIKNVKNQR